MVPGADQSFTGFRLRPVPIQGETGVLRTGPRAVSFSVNATQEFWISYEPADVAATIKIDHSGSPLPMDDVATLPPGSYWIEIKLDSTVQGLEEISMGGLGA